MAAGRRPSCSKMVEHLESLIASGIYRPGDKLPTLRELCGEFELTSYAVHQGLLSLQEKGLVTLRHGSGAYVARRRQGREAEGGWDIQVFVGSDMVGAGYLSCSMTGIQEAAMRAGCAMTIRKRDYYAYYSPVPPLQTVIGNSQGVILLGEYDYLECDIPRTIPSVGIEMSSTYDGLLSPVSIDPIAAAELAVQFFRRRRCRRVQVHYLKGGKAFEMRAEMFRYFWSAFGEVEMIPYVVGADRHEVLPMRMDCGILCCSGSWCEVLAKGFRRAHGRELADCIDVLSIDGKSLVMPGYAQVSTIDIDWRAAGEAAFSELIRRLEHPSAEARRIFLVPQLHEVGRRNP